MKIIGAAALAALLALSAMPSAAQSPKAAAKPRQSCFWTQSVNNFAAPDDRNVYIRVGVKDVYHMEIFGSCPDIDWAQRVALVSRGSSSICEGMDAELVTGSPIGPQRCPVRSIQKLTPAEVAALPKKARP